MLSYEAAAEAGVVALPDVDEKEIDDSYKFILIMSDGVWETVSSNKLCKVTESHLFNLHI